jgi:hypothetical protein
VDIPYTSKYVRGLNEEAVNWDLENRIHRSVARLV